MNYLNFYDAINSEWLFSDNSGLIDDVAEFLEPWVNNRGYPLIHVWLSPGGLTVTQVYFLHSSPISSLWLSFLVVKSFIVLNHNRIINSYP